MVSKNLIMEKGLDIWMIIGMVMDGPVRREAELRKKTTALEVPSQMDVDGLFQRDWTGKI
jgi:hypothetical protein